MASASEDDVIDNGGEGDDDLFGSEDGSAEKVRELSDRELDSGVDEDRNDRALPTAEGDEVDYVTKEAQVLDSTVWRHPLPNPADGEVSFNLLSTASKLMPD